jgi:ABC-type hemin transport system ATPase subunit
MPPALHAHALWKSYAAGVRGCSARVWALRGLSLAVQQGERVAIVSRPAGGATTLLHCLAGLRTPDAGMIERSDLPVFFADSPLALAQAARRRRGLLLVDELGAHPRSLLESCSAASTRRLTIVAVVRPAEVPRLGADRVLLLHDGRLVPVQDEPSAWRVAERPRTVASGGCLR